MGYITNTIKAIFFRGTESNEINEEKLSPEDKKILAKMKEIDKTVEIEDSFLELLKTGNKKSKNAGVGIVKNNDVKPKPKVNDTKADKKIERDER